MRRWLVIGSLFSAGAAHAAPIDQMRLPLASRFDLTRSIVRPATATTGPAATSRWLTADIAPPPGPPRDPPMLRIRGRKVKFRMSF